MKTCRKCGQTKPLDRFYIDRSKRDGRDSWCRTCRNDARMQKYYDNHEHEKQRSIDYYQAHREEKRIYQKRYNDEHRQERAAAFRARYHSDPEFRKRYASGGSGNREKHRAQYMKRHGGIDEWARMYDAQAGLCYLCKRPLPEDGKDVHVDHDHSCCEVGPRDSHSCQHCRRGLTHQACNQIWGLAREDGDLLRMMADNGERVRDETRRRIAAKSYAQGALI